MPATRSVAQVGMSNAAVSDFTTGNVTDYVVTQTGTMSASRVLTLPLAAKVPAGGTVTFIDVSFTITTTNTVVVTAGGSDTIGNAGTTDTISTPGAFRRYVSDGASKWLVDGGAYVMKTVAGAVSDGSFDVAPPNGTLAYDSTNHKFYVRDGGAWKASAALT